MNDPIIIVIIFFLLLVSLTMFILAFAKPKQKEDIVQRLEKLRTSAEEKTLNPDKDLDEKKLKTKKEIDNLSKKFSPLIEKVLNGKLEQDYREKLTKAGKYDTSVANFMTTRFLLLFSLPAAFFILNILLEVPLDQSLLLMAVCAVCGYFLPLARLNREIEDRQRRIFRALPDMLDLLTICLESGMGINEALNKVAEKSKSGDLKDEIERTLREIQIGNPRLQALRDMAKRIDLKEFSSVIVAIVQAEQMGTSLSRTLKIQSEIIREIRWQKAQEMAQKAPIKMVIPIALFIFPTIFIVIFGPLVLNFLAGNK